MKEKPNQTLFDTKYHQGIQRSIWQFHSHFQSTCRPHCYSNQAEWVQFGAYLLCNMSIFKKKSKIAARISTSCPLTPCFYMEGTSPTRTAPTGANVNSKQSTFLQFCQLSAHLQLCQRTAGKLSTWLRSPGGRPIDRHKREQTFSSVS